MALAGLLVLGSPAAPDTELLPGCHSLSQGSRPQPLVVSESTRSPGRSRSRSQLRFHLYPASRSSAPQPRPGSASTPLMSQIIPHLRPNGISFPKGVLLFLDELRTTNAISDLRQQLLSVLVLFYFLLPLLLCCIYIYIFSPLDKSHSFALSLPSSPSLLHILS